MARRALLLVSLAVVLFAWCIFSSIGALLLYHLVTNLFSRAQTYSLSFQHDGVNSLLAETEISSNGLLAVTVRLTLPESDANLANSAAPLRICVNDNCVRNTIALRFRSPTHRTARAVLLTVPLLAGIVDEYQRVAVNSIIDSTNMNSRLSVIIEAPLQISEAQVVINQRQPPFTSYFTKTLFAAILAYWYTTLACAIVTLRMCNRLQTAISRRFWPFASKQQKSSQSENCAPSQTCKSEHHHLVGQTKQNEPNINLNDSSHPIFEKSSAQFGTSLRQRRMTVKGAPDSAPDCLLNGTYVK